MIELTVSGLPGARESQSFFFDPGLNRLTQSGPVRPEILIELFTSLLYPAPGRNGMLGPGKAQEATLTFESRGTTYRIARNYLQNSIRFSQLEPGCDDSYREISHDLSFVREALGRSAQVPRSRVFRFLLVSRLSDRLPAEEVSVPVAKGIRNPEERLPGLRRELETHRKILEVGSRVDELQGRIQRADERLRRFEEPRKQLAEVDSEYEQYKIFDRPGLLVPDLTSKLAAYPAAQEKRSADLEALEEKRIRTEADLAGLPDRPLWKEPVGLIGAVAIPFSFAAIGLLRHQRLAFALSCIVFIGAMVVAALGYFAGQRRITRRSELAKQIAGFAGERAGIEKRFEIETAAARKFFAETGNNDSSDLLALLERHADLSGQRKVVADEIEALRREVPEEELRKEREEAVREVAKLESQLSDLPPVTGDLSAIRLEILRLEEVARTPEPVGGFRPLEEARPDDPNGLIRLAASIVGRTPEEVIAFVRPGLEMNLSRLSNGRLRGVDVTGDSISSFRDDSNGKFTWSDLGLQQRAQVLFAIQFTLWQAVGAGNRPLPIVLDLNSSAAADPALRDLSRQAAEHLSRKTQVLILGG
ncbi:MAG: hypothetical protein V1495_10270 [Pseudomonadota bacterium]